MLLKIKLEPQGSSILMLQLWVMLLKLLWLNSINLLKISLKQDHCILWVKIKTVLNQKCHSTQLTNMLFLLSDNKVLITIMLPTLRVPQKKFGNIVAESFIKENTKLLMLKKTKSSKLSILDSVRTVKEFWVSVCFHSTKKSSMKTSISTLQPQTTSISQLKITFSSV